MSNLQTLLDDVTKTGKVPDTDTINAVIDGARTAQDRHAARQQLTKACRAIAHAVTQGQPSSAAQAAQEAAESLARYTKGGETFDASTIPFETFGTNNAKAPVNRASLAQLKDLFAQAAHGQRIYAADVAELTTTDAPAEQVQAWRTQVLSKAEEIRRFRDTGQNGNARRLAENSVHELGHMLRGAEATRHDDVQDPRGLADLISGQGPL